MDAVIYSAPGERKIYNSFSQFQGSTPTRPSSLSSVMLEKGAHGVPHIHSFFNGLPPIISKSNEMLHFVSFTSTIYLFHGTYDQGGVDGNLTLLVHQFQKDKQSRI